MGDVCPDTSASVIISYTYDAKCFAGIFRQLAKIYNIFCLFVCHEFNCYGQVLVDYFVHLIFDRLNLFRCRRRGKNIVTFTFFPFYMGIT